MVPRVELESTRRETELERWDRNFQELLQELRVAQTGAQIVAASVVALAYVAGAHATTPVWRTVFVVTLSAAIAAMVLLLAPVSVHRMLFRRGLKPRIVVLVARLTQAGLCCVLTAMAGAIFLVVYPTAGWLVATTLAAGALAFGAAMWYLLPARERRRHRLRPR